MVIAVISDIHGNIAALEAVLADIERRQVELIVNLGDLLSGGLFPYETAECLMTLGMPTIRGNHERQLLTFESSALGLSDRFAASRINSVHRDWLKTLPATRRVTEDVLMVHGTPGGDLEYFLHTVTEAGLREATDDEIAERAGSEVAQVIVCGHTHLPGLRTLADGRLIVNPGSVGLPAYDGKRPYPHRNETGSPHARYAIIKKRQERWDAELIGVTYDWEQAAKDAAKNNRMDWARALRTGYV